MCERLLLGWLIAASSTAFFAALLAASPGAGQIVTPPNPPLPFPPSVGGEWSAVIEWPHVPVSMANLPDGRILTFASNEPNDWPASVNDEFTHASVWDPVTGQIQSVPHPSHDMFCAAIVTLEDGETMVMGGRNAESSPWVSFYDFHADRWIQLDASKDLNFGRWYPTAVYLGSGEVFVAGGRAGAGEKTPELWTPGEGFTLLTGIDLTDTILSLGLLEGSGLWPLLQLHPDGTVFHHGATTMTNSIDPFGGPGGLGTITSLGPHPYGWYPDEGVSVFYDEGRILVAGGSATAAGLASSAEAYTIDLNGPGPAYQPTAPMHLPRQFLNEVVLPNGDVLVVGGSTTSTKFSDDFAVRNAESWDPDTGTWTMLNGSDQARTYHSTALLLLDGRVVSGGGGLAGETCPGSGSPGECGVDHWNVEIFSPPYLFASDDSPAVRPDLVDAPRVARVGRTITVAATPGLTGFSLVRMSGTTHTMNTDQRLLRPAWVERSPGVYDLTLHANENVLVPGFWMLFALDGEVPSVARPIQIVNDGTPRGPPIDALYHDVGETVEVAMGLEDPDGDAMSYAATGLPQGLVLEPTTGVISGSPTTPGVFAVQVLASDGSEAVSIEFSWIVSLARSEWGRVSLQSEAWETVVFEHVYREPVVVLGPPTNDESDPLAVRVRNVTPTGFELRLDEWPVDDGLHGPESLDYLVVEAGEYTIPGGGALVAGVTTGVDQANPRPVALPVGAFGQVPTVLAQITTTDGEPVAPPAAARVDAVGVDGFTLRIQPEESAGLELPHETVHWIAVEPGLVSGLLESAPGAEPIDDLGTLVSFAQPFSAPPHLFAATQTTIEPDPFTLRRRNESVASVELFGQEEASADAELVHAGEDFGWLALEPAVGTFGLVPVANHPPVLAAIADRADQRGDAVVLAVSASDEEGGPLVFSASGLPPGLSIDPATGVVDGTIDATGGYAVTITVVDPVGESAASSFLWTVHERLDVVPFPTPPGVEGDSFDYTAETVVAGDYEYAWDFGDGSPGVGPGPSPDVTHVFPGPGRYGVTLTVSDPGTGQSVTHQFFQVVVAPPLPVAPTRSRSIVYESPADRVWVANPDNDSVTLIDAVAHTRILEIDVPAGPRRLAIAADGRVWVVCKEAAAIQVLDPVALAPAERIDLAPGAGPHGLVFDPTGTVAFVALEESGEILELDGATGAILGALPVGRDVRDLAVTSDGATLLATRFLTPLLPGESSGVPATEVGGLPVGAELLRIDVATRTVMGTTVLAVSELPDTETSARGVPNQLGAPSVSPDGRQALVPSKQDNVFRGRHRDGQELTHDTTVRAITSRVDLLTASEDLVARIDHDDASVAGSTTFDALGAYAFTTLEGNRQLAIVDPVTHLELGRVETGRAPRDSVLSPDGESLFVDEFMDRSVSVFDLRPLHDFEQTSLPRLAQVGKVAVEALAPDVLLGKQLFYDAADPRLSRDRYLYCAACHAEGRQDGRVWDFTGLGEGLRNTIGLLGRGSGHGRVHWTGNFDEIQDFEAQIRRFGGTGLLSSTDYLATLDPLGDPKAGLSPELDALAAYVASLTSVGTSPARQPNGGLTPEAAAGRSVFHVAGCGGCHGGATFSDSHQDELHLVGTHQAWSGPHWAFDTPTLRGLFRNPPYLHDGSAATLLEAIDAHTSTTLTATQRSDLAAYLEQIDDAELAPPNNFPFISIDEPTTGSESYTGMPLVLAATAHDPEDGDLSAVVEWSSDLQGALGVGSPLVVYWLPAGTHTIRASVTDSAGVGAGGQVVVTRIQNQEPVLDVTLPLDNLIVPQGRPVDFAASAFDPEDGDLGAQIAWTSGIDGSLGTGTSFSRDDLSLGLHPIAALVIDSLGLADSEFLTLLVLPNTPPSIELTSPLAGLEVTVGDPVDLSALAVDPEDGDLSAAASWSSSLDGPLGVGGALVVDGLSIGTHQLEVRVSDSSGAEVSDAVEITVPEPTGLALWLLACGSLSTLARTRSDQRKRPRPSEGAHRAPQR